MVSFTNLTMKILLVISFWLKKSLNFWKVHVSYSKSSGESSCFFPSYSSSSKKLVFWLPEPDRLRTEIVWGQWAQLTGYFIIIYGVVQVVPFYGLQNFELFTVFINYRPHWRQQYTSEMCFTVKIEFECTIHTKIFMNQRQPSSCILLYNILNLNLAKKVRQLAWNQQINLNDCGRQRSSCKFSNNEFATNWKS